MIREAATSMHHRDKLMDVAFNGVGSMPMSAIDGMREQKKAEVESMLKEREAARRRQELQDSINAAAKVQEGGCAHEHMVFTCVVDTLV
jgi:pyrroline-5-carboxylate reductase